MKKVLSFVLVLAMILGCTAMAFAAPAATTVTKTNTVVPFADAEGSNVATILRDLGILKGTENGADFAKKITRAEVVTTIVRALGYECEQTATKFTDVPATHWASGYIKKANELGWADGISAKEFNPDGQVTGYEVMAFIEKALGYDSVHVAGTWPQNYSQIAAELGLYDTKVVPETAETVNREYVFTAIFKALDKHLVKWQDATANAAGKFTVLSVAYVQDGSNSATLLSKVLGTTVEKKIANYYTTSTATTVTTVAKSKNGWSNANFLGKNVTYIVNNEENIGVWSVNSKTLAGSFANDTLGKKTTFAGVTAVDSTPDNWFVNGAYYGASAPTFVTSKTAITAEVAYNKATGYITDIFSASVESMGAIFKVTTNAAAKFDVAATEMSITLVDGTTTVDLAFATEAATDAVDYSKLVLVGVDKLEDIDADAIVEVYYLAGNPDKTVWKLVVTQNKVAGLVTKKEVKNGKDYFTVGGNAYTLAKKTAQNWDKANEVAFNFTSEFALYLDKDGNIAAYGLNKEVAPAATWTYAWVLNATKAAIAGTQGWAYDETGAGKYDYKVKVLDFGASEVKELAVSTSGLFATDTTLGLPAELPFMIKYQMKSDMISTMAAATPTDFTAQKTITPTAISVDNYRYADDAKIVVLTTKSALGKAIYPTQAAYYAAKSAADIAGKKYEKVSYHRNTAGLVEYVYIEGAGTAATTNTYATFAAIVGARYEDGTTYASILVDGVVTEYVSEKYYDAKSTEYAELYDITFSAGKIINATDTNIRVFKDVKNNEAKFVTAKGITVKDTKTVYVTAPAVSAKHAFNFGLDDTVVVLTWNATAKKYEASADLAAALKAATGEYALVAFFDKDNNGVADTVVVYSNFTDAVEDTMSFIRTR